jgi:PDZ domain
LVIAVALGTLAAYHLGARSSQSLSALIAGQEASFNRRQQEEIRVVRQELEFLASKLLRITGQTEFSTTHEGHVMRAFGVCAEATDAGVKVNCISLDSTAERLGLKTGDLITEIDGSVLTDSDTDAAYQRYFATLRALREGATVSVVYVRNGESRRARASYESFFSPSYTFTVSAVRAREDEAP